MSRYYWKVITCISFVNIASDNYDLFRHIRLCNKYWGKQVGALNFLIEKCVTIPNKQFFSISRIFTTLSCDINLNAWLMMLWEMRFPVEKTFIVKTFVLTIVSKYVLGYTDGVKYFGMLFRNGKRTLWWLRHACTDVIR